LCGAIRVRLAFETDEIGVCHCETCRTWGSGPWMALQVPGSEIIGNELVVFRSSPFAERGFCRVCGTHVFHRPSDGPELALSAGLFDSRDKRISREIFADRQPAYYRFATSAVKLSSRRMAFEWAPKLLWRRLRRMLSG
jgi:hypothetical protein